ncbi:MAG: Uma2 family endonuclease [Gemmatimonadaceae bacterium]|nr:Uma2 family endonuclease [Acetobacteraceae bacterium]
MSAAVRRAMTRDEFLAWEHRQELRYEFDGAQPVSMAGGTAAHSAIQRNILYALTGRLRGQRCQPHGSELKIAAADSLRYPEAFVVCTPVPPRSTVVPDPVVVFEVLSDGSANDDLVVKNAEYRATPSIQRYVVLQQTHAGATVFSRKGEDWTAELVFGDDATLQMPEIGIEIPLAGLYIDVELVSASAL